MAVAALTLTLAALAGLVVARTLGVGGRVPQPPTADDPPAALVDRKVREQVREIEALQRRIAALSARLALTTSCNETPALVGSQPAALATADDSRAPVDGGVAASPGSGGGDVAAVSASGRDAGPPPALSTTWGTETFLRELARTSATELSLEQAVCADDVCRLAISGRGAPADDALALQNFVGRTAEWLPSTLIQPGAAGAPTVVLLARPGHGLPSSASVTIDHSQSQSQLPEQRN